MTDSRPFSRPMPLISKTLTADGHDYRIAFIEDPDGYKVELVQRGTMKVGAVIQ